jgi:outer membrane receptor protein involved in Fe transport
MQANALGTGWLLSVVILALIAGAEVSAQPDESSAEAVGDQSDSDDGGDGDGGATISFEVEEIIVEGSRGQGIREVPISVTQFGASDIQNLRIQNVADLSAYTPNLEINTAFAASNPTLFIRGVGLKDYNSNSTGAVGIWHDGIMMNSPSAQLFSIYDIESIEVLRGPVGGLGGRNSTAGAIRLHSFKPNNEWTGSGNLTYGNLDNVAFEGAVGFPVFPEMFNDTLSGRISGITEFRDPYTNNTCSDWDPSEYGLLTSTEEATRDFYAKLDPSAVEVLTSSGTSPIANDVKPRFIYQNTAAVQEYNNAPAQAGLNFARLLDGPGGTPGTLVGIQNNRFTIAADRVCLLENAGRLTTFEGAGRRRPEGSWDRNVGAIPISNFEGLEPSYNDVKYWALRGQLLYQPTDTLDFLMKFHWGQNRGDSLHGQQVGVAAGQIDSLGETITQPLGFTQKENSDGWSEILDTFAPFETPKKRKGLGPVVAGDAPEGTPGFAGKDVFNGFYSSDGKEKLDLMGTSVTANAEFDWGRVTTILGWEKSDRDIEDEGDACPCTPLLAFLEDDTWQVTPEVKATIEGDGYSVDVGFFYLHEELDSRNFYPSSLRFALDQNYEQTTDAWNIGTNVHYDFLEEDWRPGIWQVSLDAGFRYNWEKKDFTLGTVSQKLNSGATKVSIPEESVGDTWDAPTAEITLSYMPLETTRLYAKFTRAFKAGHYNAGLTTQPVAGSTESEALQSLDAVDPEYVNAVEVGLKSSWFDGRLELSGALFRYWYDDLQVFDIVNEAGAIPTQQLLNADANVLGAEVELTVRPVEGLMFSTGFGWIDSEFGTFIVEKVVQPPVGIPTTEGVVATFDYKGNPLIAAPEFSWSGYVEYELPLYRYGSLIPSFDFSWKSRTYMDPQKEELLSQAPYWTLNARLAYRTSGGIELAGWVKNFMNQTYKIDSFDNSRQYRSVFEVWGEPRTYGATVTYLW